MYRYCSRKNNDLPKMSVLIPANCDYVILLSKGELRLLSANIIIIGGCKSEYFVPFHYLLSFFQKLNFVCLSEWSDSTSKSVLTQSYWIILSKEKISQPLLSFKGKWKANLM